MKDPTDTATTDLLQQKTKAQRFREKQISAGFRQFSFWLTEDEARIIRDHIEHMRGGK